MGESSEIQINSHSLSSKEKYIFFFLIITTLFIQLIPDIKTYLSYFIVLSLQITNIKMSLDEIREKHAAGNETAAEAFHELCSMVEAIECEREERREKVQAKVSTLRTMNARLREKNQTLKAKYHALLGMYNALAEEVHDASDSSSSSDDDSDGECSIM